jgi:hypothetical protein
MKREGVLRLAFLVAAAALAMTCADAMAQSKSERCAAYARNAAQSTPTTTGVGRGAARGAIGGAFGGNAGRGAAAGAVIGGTRKVAQRSRSYQSYYSECMSR